MAYIGNQADTAFTSLIKQDLTGASGDSLTLTHAVSNANDIALYINNVRQEPTSAYSTNGTAVSLTGSVGTSDDIYVIYLARAVQTTVPPDGSVSTAKIANSAVSSAKIASSAVNLTSKVTGVLPVANGGTGINSSLAFFNIDGSASTTTNTSFNKIQYSTVVLDTKSGWDSSNKWWEVPTNGAGYYHITAQVALKSMTTNQTEVRIYKNASTIINVSQFDAQNTNTAYHYFVHTLNTVQQLSADDYIWVGAKIADGTGNVSGNGCTLTIRQVQ